MIILWNSAGIVVELTLVDDAGAQTSYEWPAGRTLARDMLAYLRDRLAEHGKTLADINGIGARARELYGAADWPNGAQYTRARAAYPDRWCDG